jgi:hypothetical protein
MRFAHVSAIPWAQAAGQGLFARQGATNQQAILDAFGGRADSR